MHHPVIAVDGPAASGKGTVARRLAELFGFAYLDTGLLYRAVGVLVLRAGGDPADPDGAGMEAGKLAPATAGALFEDPVLRGDDAAAAASKVAAVPAVRAALLAFQRDFAAHPPAGAAGAVLDGRDIGTVVCPEADAKIFVTASVEVRADRRFKELQNRGIATIKSDVLADLIERDERDSRRAVAPLRPAVDAFLLDTSELGPDQVLEAALAYLHTKPGFMEMVGRLARTTE